MIRSEVEGPLDGEPHGQAIAASADLALTERARDGGVLRLSVQLPFHVPYPAPPRAMQIWRILSPPRLRDPREGFVGMARSGAPMGPCMPRRSYQKARLDSTPL
eukprot:8883729-Pyramimonas_sp.AAC.2